MMVNEDRGQGAMEVLLAVGIAIVLATIVGLILKGVFGGVQNNVTTGTNAVVHKIN